MKLIAKLIILQGVILLLIQLSQLTFAAEHDNNDHFPNGTHRPDDDTYRPHGRFLWGGIGNLKCRTFGNSTAGNSSCALSCAFQGRNLGGYCDGASCVCF